MWRHINESMVLTQKKNSGGRRIKKLSLKQTFAWEGLEPVLVITVLPSVGRVRHKTAINIEVKNCGVIFIVKLFYNKQCKFNGNSSDQQVGVKLSKVCVF